MGAVSATARYHWSNWAGNQRCAPARTARPVSVDEVVDAVSGAADAGLAVKVAGTGHSFTDVACTSGLQLSLDRMNRVLHHDRESGRVTVEAGITLRRLNDELARLDLALPNLGDIAYQSLAGTMATSTHGTGLRHGGLATRVEGVQMVGADGSVVSCSTAERPDVLAAARVSLGALGVVTSITLATVPAFNLKAVEEPMRLDDVLSSLDEMVASNEHFEFFWVPHTPWALTKRNNRTDEPATARSGWREVRDRMLLENVAFGAVCRLGRLRPEWVPALARAVPSSGRTEFVERSDKVFTSPRWVRFCEMEYSIPKEHARAAIEAVRDLIEDTGLMVSFPVEVRFTAADDIPLSTASGRESCYIAVHMYKGVAYEQYFRGVEDIMTAFGGRPHWGKLHFQTAADLAPRYPGWESFRSVRRTLDPEGRFANAYTDRVLGAP
jgi:FAD-linked oxidoreductase